MGKYRRLTLRDRYQIEALLGRGISIRAIAKQFDRSASTISREIRKMEQGRYQAEEANFIADRKRLPRYTKMRKLKGRLKEEVERKLLQDWSPEQIVGRIRLKKEKRPVCFQTIYRHVDRDKKQGGKLFRHLRVLRRQQKDRKDPKWHPIDNMPDRIMIEERPRIVERRKRLGDYERDTVLGIASGSALLTVVDRTSRLTKLAWLPVKNSQQVHKATVRILKNEPLHTITNDNGTEFSNHKKTAKTLNIKIYFSRAYRAWERGTNENTNGLLRQYFPRRHDIGKLSLKQVRKIERLINCRPRKTLGYHTPHEIHQRLKSALR